jgi:hypothetical protein
MANESTSLYTLEEYLHFYTLLGWDEQNIVELYIKEQGLEMQYSDMIMKLMQSALYKEQYKNNKAKEVIQYYNNCCGIPHNSEWTNEENILWDKWVIEYALNFKLSESTKEVIKQKVPQMIAPNWGYRGLLAYINKECGVLFKNQTEPEDFDLLEIPKANGLTRW